MEICGGPDIYHRLSKEVSNFPRKSVVLLFSVKEWGLVCRSPYSEKSLSALRGLSLPFSGKNTCLKDPWHYLKDPLRAL